MCAITDLPQKPTMRPDPIHLNTTIERNHSLKSTLIPRQRSQAKQVAFLQALAQWHNAEQRPNIEASQEVGQGLKT